jgi:hypothetical protein
MILIFQFLIPVKTRTGTWQGCAANPRIEERWIPNQVGNEDVVIRRN